MSETQKTALLQRIVNVMTNWQRAQWAKNGYKVAEIMKWFRTRRDGATINKAATERALQGKLSRTGVRTLMKDQN